MIIAAKTATRIKARAASWRGVLTAVTTAATSSLGTM